MGLMDKLKGLVKEHPDKADQGMDKASETVKGKFGHEEQVDKATEKGKEYFKGSGEQGGDQGAGGQGPGEQPGPPPEQKPGG